MIELTCLNCRVTDSQSLTCEACQTAFQLRGDLKESVLLREVLGNSNSSTCYHKNGRLIDLKYSLLKKQVIEFKKILIEMDSFKKIDSMNLGDYEIYIETVYDTKTEYWEVRVLLHLPNEVADPNYCFIKH
jgi:hypothetical protein